MARKTRNQEEENKNNASDDRNTIVFWLQKVHDKMEDMEMKQQEQCKLLKNQQSSIDKINKEVSSIKEYFNNGYSRSRAESLEHVRWHFTINFAPVELQLLFNQSYLKNDPPFIPKKFREGQIPGETEQQRKRKQRMETFKLTLEIEKLQEESRMQQAKIDETERINKSENMTILKPEER